MGRTSKFTFPYPGRKSKTKEARQTKDADQSDRTTLPGLNTSKAQRVLGTGGDLNIDSPYRDDVSYRSIRPMSRGMSIAVSESTHDGEESYRSRSAHNDDWDAESGVLPSRLLGKASSTLLGRRFHEDAAADDSSMQRRLRGENSSSTLRSYYDRQKSPLSVSQQTSASSIRDQALRKGFPPVAPIPRSPLLNVEFLGNDQAMNARQQGAPVAAEPSSKKKPARLDLSRMFSRSNKGQNVQSPEDQILSPASSKIRVSEADGRKKLAKADSRGKVPQARTQGFAAVDKDAIRPAKTSQQTSKDFNPEPVHHSTVGNVRNVAPASTQHRPENRANNTPVRVQEQMRSPLATDEQFSWNGVRAGLSSPPIAPWDKRSITSNSSRNTKGSRHTSTSVFSSSDLRNNSVLSLSSEEDSDEEKSTSPTRTRQPQVTSPTRHGDRSSEKALRPIHENSAELDSQFPVRASKKSSPPSKLKLSTTKTSRNQDDNFLTIPLPSPAGSRISGPWNPKKRDSKADYQSSSSSGGPEPDYMSSRSSRRGSVASVASSTMSSQYMHVTRQEQALLEAMRKKRMRMKEEIKKSIIAEEETKRSPPPSRSSKHERIRDSKSSTATSKTVTSIRDHGKHRVRDDSKNSQRTITERDIGVGHGKHRKRDLSKDSQSVEKSEEVGHILMYLDRPVRGSGIETAEPSPDLSDFLSFGSDDDEDETPRTSWIVPKDPGPLQRPDSFATSPNLVAESPRTPKSVARLSAVGAFGGLEREDNTANRSKGVTFDDERHTVALGADRRDSPNGHDFLDDVDDDVVWGI
jgi:hypothetical protein